MKRWAAVAFVGVAFAGCASHPKSQTSDVFEQLAGKWSEESANCKNPHTLTFGDNNRTMLIEYAEIGWVTENDSRKAFRYRILGIERSALRVQLENEPRLDDQGRPVVWHIVAVDAETYCWGRDDWPEDGCTPPRKRCEI